MRFELSLRDMVNSFFLAFFLLVPIATNARDTTPEGQGEAVLSGYAIVDTNYKNPDGKPIRFYKNASANEIGSADSSDRFFYLRKKDGTKYIFTDQNTVDNEEILLIPQINRWDIYGKELAKFTEDKNILMLLIVNKRVLEIKLGALKDQNILSNEKLNLQESYSKEYHDIESEIRTKDEIIHEELIKCENLKKEFYYHEFLTEKKLARAANDAISSHLGKNI
ncbi:hypothetical protein ACTVH1_15660 [Gluconobacter cerinus]|uniref:hypothetical protein n=1 Tax=Gluconobacter oxydans TaxID=442 RepID=UPI0039E77F15